MQPSRRTFLKTAAVSAGAFWAYPAHAQAKYEVRIHFLGLFLALKDKHGVPLIVSLKDLHETHRVHLAVHPDNYSSGVIGTLKCNKAQVRAFRISKGDLEGPTADEAVKPTYPTTSGRCPATLDEWRDPRWHVKLAAIGVSEKPNWPAESAVDVKMKVESNAIEAEPPLIESARTLMWTVGKVTQPLTDRLLYVVKTNDPTFKFNNQTLQLKAVGNQAINVYVLTVPKKLTSTIQYKKGDKLPHFKIGHSVLQSGTPIPVAVDECDDVAKDLVAPEVVTALYECLFPDVKLVPLLSRTVFCPGYGTYP